MALQKLYTKSIFGQILNFDSAYHQITYVSGDKNNILIQVTVYDTENKLNTVNQKNYSFVPDISDTSNNIFKQGYEYLKTLDDYIGATDVLETGQTA